MQKVSSEQVAAAMLKKLVNYAKQVQSKERQTKAEKRHLLRLRTVKALRDSNW